MDSSERNCITSRGALGRRISCLQTCGNWGGTIRWVVILSIVCVVDNPPQAVKRTLSLKKSKSILTSLGPPFISTTGLRPSLLLNSRELAALGFLLPVLVLNSPPMQSQSLPLWRTVTRWLHWIAWKHYTLFQILHLLQRKIVMVSVSFPSVLKGESFVNTGIVEFTPQAFLAGDLDLFFSQVKIPCLGLSFLHKGSFSETFPQVLSVFDLRLCLSMGVSSYYCSTNLH